jgi:predicted secreted protein
LFSVVANGVNIVITRKVAAANDATLNLAYADDTSGGITDDASSNNTTAGVALATIAQVQSIGGPSLALDTEDVTTHDSTNGWEEVVGTILRSGEVTIDIVYDPAEDTHDATAGNGLLSRLKNNTLTDFSLVFSDGASTTWSFDGYVTGFEPSAPHDGALTASVTAKITGDVTLV